MARVNDENWLDEALDKAIGSDDTRPDFEAWKARHPEAVQELTSRTPQQQRPPRIRRIAMNGLFVKLAAAAAIVIAGIFGIYQYSQSPGWMCWHVTLLEGPTIHTLGDGSTVKLAESAQVWLYSDKNARGFTHIAGVIDVTVAKGKGEFVVHTPYGDVKALGTQFTLDLVDGVADTGQQVQLLAVEVTKGKVEVRNAKGATTLKARQDAIVGKDVAPYDFRQDQTLPARLKERIGAMVAAFEAGDRVAWAANFNQDYVYRLVKGQVPYDPNLFGGTAEDVERLKQTVAQVKSIEEMKQMLLRGVNITEPIVVYVRGVELSQDGQHARAECIRRKSANHIVITRPEWHHFDNDWWQVDD